MPPSDQSAEPEIEQPIARRSIQATAFTLTASGITLVLGFVRSILLANALLQGPIGTYTLALFFASLLSKAKNFGFSAAMVHRKLRSDEDISSHFVLQFALSLFVFLLSVLLIPVLRLFYPLEPMMPIFVVAITGIGIIKSLNTTPRVLLSKKLDFKRIAVLDVLSSITAMAVAVPLALAGAGAWSLVGERLSGAIVRFIGFWFYRRPWRISLKTSWESLKWYLNFGWFTFLSANLNLLLDRFDDFWTGSSLGGVALGSYAKAFEFAGYTRRVIAEPLITVLFPTFAQLQDDRERLSKAYFRVCSLIVRFGFLFAGIFFLVTPEFLRIFLDPTWWSIETIFRLMLIYTLFDPIFALSGRLIVAMGQPRILTRIKLIQIMFFVPAVIVLAKLFGVFGVAVAADLMLLVGSIILVPRLRQYVDFSLFRLLATPSLGLAAALSTAWALTAWLDLSGNLWLSLLVKAVVTAIVYGSLLLLLERHFYVEMWERFQKIWRS
jgi:PST family polysaccharide transporter